MNLTFKLILNILTINNYILFSSTFKNTYKNINTCMNINDKTHVLFDFMRELLTYLKLI